MKAVLDDGARALDELSADMIELTDQLVDAKKQIRELSHEVAVMSAQYEWDEREIARLKRQTTAVKKLIPGPLRRLLGKRFGDA